MEFDIEYAYSMAHLENIYSQVMLGDINEAIGATLFLKENGFKASEYSKIEDRQLLIDWYLGQLIKIVENESWFALNTWCNTKHTLSIGR